MGLYVCVYYVVISNNIQYSDNYVIKANRRKYTSEQILQWSTDSEQSAHLGQQLLCEVFSMILTSLTDGYYDIIGNQCKEALDT